MPYSIAQICARAAIVALLCAGFSACSRSSKQAFHPPIEFSVQSPYIAVRTFAVAPAINLSGSRDFDPLVVSDTLFAELQQVENIQVVPLNKTILAMQRLGIRHIDDVKQAQALAVALGADGLVIPAITAYDPYNPPTVGMILQLYTPDAAPTAGPIAQATVPVRVSSVRTNPDAPVLAEDLTPIQAAVMPQSAPTAPPAGQPVTQVSAVFNANNQTVLKELALFARGRSQYGTALEEARYLMDSDSYMRFVCHAMVRRLMDVERMRSSDR